MSLLELPIITDIEQDEVVTKLIISSHNESPTSSSAAADESQAEANYMIVGDELIPEESSHGKDNANKSTDAEQTILWGCKQCDFRFVDKKQRFHFILSDVSMHFSFLLQHTH